MDEFTQREIVTADGHTIIARLFGSPHASIGAALVVPAMGASQKYYADFAAWLAGRGFLVATFDYRGTGLSRRGSLSRFDADILDWARLDCAAVLESLSQLAPNRPLYWIGHSLGGQILPFVPNLGLVAKILTIATGNGYWRKFPLRLRASVWWLWYIIAPLSLRLFGYFPGKALRKVGDLPSGVMAQWRRWCLDPDYAAGAEGARARALYASVRAPIVSLSFTDDELMSAWSIESIHDLFVNAPRKMKRIAPADVGAARIGHFGFFRPAFEGSLWRRHVLPELAGGAGNGSPLR
jgi:predicted alpha/beta hydrolase